jgi:hypothetical protein
MAEGARRRRDGRRRGRRGAWLAAPGALVAGSVLVAVATLGRGGSSSSAHPVGQVAQSAVVSADATVHDFVGLHYAQVAAGEEFPAGVLHVGDGLVVDEHWRPGQPVSYIWAHVRQASRQMLWFQRVVGQQGPTRTLQVLDAVDMGPVDDGYQLQVESCRQGTGEPDPEIAGLVRYAGEEEDGGDEQAQDQEKEDDRPAPTRDEHDDGDDVHGEDGHFETSSDVRAAWRLDRSAGRIVPISTAGVVCQSTGD